VEVFIDLRRPGGQLSEEVPVVHLGGRSGGGHPAAPPPDLGGGRSAAPPPDLRRAGRRSRPRRHHHRRAERRTRPRRAGRRTRPRRPGGGRGRAGGRGAPGQEVVEAWGEGDLKGAVRVGMGEGRGGLSTWGSGEGGPADEPRR
jgi:hypothetical protein